MSIFLLTSLVIVGFVGTLKFYNINKENIKLSNQLAQSQKAEQETTTAWSVAAQRVADLEATSKDLQKKIKDRDETVAALGATTLKLKNQLFKITNAKVVLVDSDLTNHCTIPTLRIEFEKEQDPWLVQGYCWTDATSAGAEVGIAWTRPLQLSFIMTKKNNQYRLYLDSNSPDAIAVESLSLKVDSSVFALRWYEKLRVGLDLGWSGVDPTLAVRSSYEIGSFAPGIFMLLFNGKEGIQRSFGASLMWRPFLNGD
ncbi:MAG: hypothetical protein Q8Q92_03360 [bacterium]|nr:hypothetical protein [bacterium]